MPEKNGLIVYTDPTGQEWTLDELQALIIHIGLPKAAKRLGTKSTKWLRLSGLKTPTEIVKQKATINSQWLTSVIIRRGSVSRAAQYLNVSQSFLKSLLTEIGIVLQDPEPPVVLVKAALKKFGSPIIAARLFDTTVSVIKKILPEWRDLKDPTKAGDHSVRTGYIGERYYKSLRRDFITSSPAEVNHNNKGYDFVDTEFNRVNVKATVITNNNTWTWDINPDTECDSLALCQMTKQKVPIGMVVIPIKALFCEGSTAEFRRSKRVDGKIAFSTKRLFNTPPLTFYYLTPENLLGV